MSECKHGYYCKYGTPCVLCHEDELADLRASNARLREALEYLKRSITVTEHKLPFQLNKSKWLREIEAALEVKP